MEKNAKSGNFCHKLHTEIVLFFVQHERAFLLQFLFLLTLGPQLPQALFGPGMLEIHGDVFSFGGREASMNDYISAIYRLTCSSGICCWLTINQELKVPRLNPVVILVPDNFCLEEGKSTTSEEREGTTTTKLKRFAAP